MAKALLIKSSAGAKENIQGVWHLFDQATPYIQGIETGDIAEKIDADVLNRMISGLPSVWARARVFGFAFRYTQKDVNIQTSGLIKFYESLVREWKGLVALLALLPDRITISEPIYFNGTASDNLYNIPNGFGRMLFDDTDLWCNPEELQTTKNERPFIQNIYYNNVLIGAISPYSLVFTAVDYNAFPRTADVPWFRNNRLDDPLEFGNLTSIQIQKLYLLVSNMVAKLPDVEKRLQTNRNGREPMKLSALFQFLTAWKAEIKAKGTNIVDEGTLDAELRFAEPYLGLFRIKQDLYYRNGMFSFSDANGDIVDLQKILLQDDFLFSFNETDEQQPLREAAVHFLTAQDPQNASKKWYFPIPLSAYGIGIFKNQVGEMLSAVAENKHELRASFKAQGFKLVVELFLVVDGKKQTPISKEYEVKLLTGAQRNVIVWPNFISNQWNSYYLYSEYPSNSRDVKMVPFFRKFGENGGFEAGGYISDNKNQLVYVDSDMLGTGLEVTRLVRYPVEIATSDDHPYEIIRANKPIAGLEIRSLIGGKDRVCGYLVVKKPNDDSMMDKKIADLSYETNFDDVVVGIDFGSNNSCVSFSRVSRGDVEPAPFSNRRMFLVGNEVIDPNREKTAERHELLFFQNDRVENGQVKSWIHDHNHRYLSATEQEELSGGIPVFEPNIIIHDMDERTITTNAGTMHHSVKWLTDIKGKEKKKAYLKTVWMQVCADMYAQRLRPRELRWSYPGSFSQFDVLQYEQMYNELSRTPIEGHTVEVSTTPSTESEAVCNYALANSSLSSRNILMGVDVGGSTSDILIVAMDRQARAFRLVKQSSLRVAAGLLSQIIIKSPALRDAVYKYHESPKCRFKVANIKKMIDKPSTAPFYLNAVLDRLRDDDFQTFYSALSQTYPTAFAIPAYLSGLVLYYGGQLVAQAIKQNGFNDVTIVDLLPFGKGGRMFDWLDVYPGKQRAAEYYNKCFKTGFGDLNNPIKLEKKDSIRKDNKSEVAKGLSAPQKVTVDAAVRQQSDIFGENGFRFFPQGGSAIDLTKDSVIEPRHFEEMDFGIEMPTQFEEFNKFLTIYLDFVGPNKTGIIRNIANIENKRNELGRELQGYIVNDAEWQKASQQKKEGMTFDYKHSMLALEGMCFLDKFIIPEVFK